MGFFNFMESVGAKIGLEQNAPGAAELKTALDQYKLGTEGVDIKVADGQATLTGEIKDRSAFEKAILAVGNSIGISSVNADSLKITDAAGGDKDSQFYEVKKGDTLWKIAEAFYGKEHGDKNKVIFNANKPMLKKPDAIYPGQILRIPPLH